MSTLQKNGRNKMDRVNKEATSEVEVENEGGNRSAPTKKKGPGKSPTVIVVDPLAIQRATITLVGETPLLMNNFSNKGTPFTTMRDRMLGIPAPKNRPPKDPVRDFIGALYCIGDPKITGTMKGFMAGKPVTAKGKFYLPFSMVKGAIETAATDVDGASKAGVRRAVRIVEDKVPLIGDDPYMVEHVVRLSNGAPDIRYRAQFDKWQVTFAVDINTATLSVERLVNLFNAAGFSAGLGDWRPEKGGEFGRFAVKHGKQR
jgi:hypothetical protein